LLGGREYGLNTSSGMFRDPPSSSREGDGSSGMIPIHRNQQQKGGTKEWPLRVGPTVRELRTCQQNMVLYCALPCSTLATGRRRLTQADLHLVRACMDNEELGNRNRYFCTVAWLRAQMVSTAAKLTGGIGKQDNRTPAGTL